MKKCEFSETQFSFCFTFEYITRFYPFVPLPIFPNTYWEGRKGGGYDVKIKGNIFFQFKIPTYHDNVYRPYWDVFGHDYYKMKLDTNGKQYELLKALVRPFNKVYYAVPEFHTITELYFNYSKSSIESNSGIFALNYLPAYGSGKHHLIFSPRHNWANVFSDPYRIDKVQNINPYEIFAENDNLEITIYSQALQLRSLLLEDVENSELLEESKDPQTLVKSVHSLLLAKYNVHWYPIIDF
ncbi:hypothetical protein [Flavobacterium sharifuzzamanii]|uniref:hypothetical protein n=1 Tax=Flavobacterium sharifuzzamanii TaxID=2211133 RepID=UPI000DAC436B|nr:hypothetical protein [Flavobacterium sharifuzzamanii]KAF2082067.1 hypothetical protein DMA14_06245 [Flavobacterium sharifuzzamanii]